MKCGGILAIWSAYPVSDFGARLEDAGFDVDELATPAFTGSKDEFHYIWFARRVD